jgi:hypothetical protein
MAEVMRRQMRAVGMLHALAPVMDVARDARRGRVTEWPPNESNILEPALWRLELLVCGDNITPERAFFTISFDGAWPEQGREAIWDHFVVGGPFAAPPPNRVLSMEQSR